MPSAHAEKEHKTTLRGCLSGGPGKFYIASVDGDQLYELRGNTSALIRYVGKEISVQGEKDVSTQPLPSFEVIRVKEALDTPKPSLSPSFSNPSMWHRETNQTYGIKFAHPDGLSGVSASELSTLQANFVADQNVVTVSRLEISREVYPHTNFVGGAFAIFVNPEITNAQSCSEFGDSDPQFRSSYSLGNIQYTRMTIDSVAAGTTYGNEYFHTFQNGLCYELAFDFGEYNTAYEDLGCTVPVMREEDELKLIEPLIAGISFIHPTIAVARQSNPHAVPRVTQFEASSKTADDVTNRGQITFSWSTQDADYVEFSYQCVPAPSKGGVVIQEEGGSRDCENSSLRTYLRDSLNSSPNASQNIGFGNFHQSDPVSVIVTITPFSHAIPYPDSSKSITIQVDPDNPFPKGVPTANGNILLTYSPSTNEKGDYQQGSSLTIGWTDERFRDRCVNLYLVQDDGRGGESYRLQIAGNCLRPARSGSYSWTIPDKYSGFGYRIFAGTPGGTSTGLGPSFTIIRPPLHQ